ncbi:MAG TPA: serine kinase [Rhizobiaceae bacterium]
MARTAARTLEPGQRARHVNAPFTVSQDSLLAYANDRIKAASEFPKANLIRRELRLAGLDMAVWFTSEPLADLCDALLVRHEGWGPFEQAAEIFLLDAESEGWEPPAVWDGEAGFSSHEFERILAAGNRRGFYHHDAPSWQFYDTVAGLGVHTLPGPLAIPPWEHGSPLRLFVHWCQAAAGRRLTHAAALGVNGIGALIVGASGSGKSGTTLAGLMNGLDSVGDDYVVVEHDPCVVAHAVFKVFKQDPDGLRRVGLNEADLPGAKTNWSGKIEFDAASLAPDAFTNRMEIRALLLPRITRAKRTSIEPVTSHDAALALAPSAVLQLPGDATEGFRFFASLAKRLPAFRVNLSQDAAEIADSIRSFLATGAGHSG